ncbi:restriction endonuclease subunit S [Propionimicrobium lymphophilum]|nr:restriction endonuclease subunit S [Propionimicrobium lymphophilum]MDK7709465.1 restriction endonuclease subunit S [Propionimicrobium lymphophilum]MDK7733451.1 restriction endonuclease subunit S [Propionimicrobium lymphophilum]
MPLSTLGTWSGGGTPSKSQASFWQGPINWFSAKDIKSTHLIDAQDKISKEAVQARGLRIHSPETLIIVARSGILKHSLPVGILEKEGTINQDLKALTTNENVTPKFALHALQNFASQILLKCHKAGGSVDSLDMKKVYSFKVPVPPLSEQERIVSILDNFDALTTDLSSGLPAEIQARRKQYEYYRDKLLTFEEAK